jgi:hypothetical protein
MVAAATVQTMGEFDRIVAAHAKPGDTFTLALDVPVPHRIDAALVATRRSTRTLNAVEHAEGSLSFRRYGSVAAARRDIDVQRV